MNSDKRWEPNSRKHPALWQSFLWWDELLAIRKRHTQRLLSIEAGRSNMSAAFERILLEETFAISKKGVTQFVPLKMYEATARKGMIEAAKAVGPIYEWLTSIRGIGAHTAAKLLALPDDIARFATASKFIRFCGLGLYEYWIDTNGKMVAPRDGYKTRTAKKGEWVVGRTIMPEGAPGARKAAEGEVARYRVIPEPKPEWRLERRADRRLKGWNLPYHNRLKSEMFILGDLFIRLQCPDYIMIYYDEKERQRVLHPEKVKANGHWKYTDGHIHNMARRKMVKIFLQHFWAKWRELESLPVSEPYVKAILGHTNIMSVPELALA